MYLLRIPGFLAALFLLAACSTQTEVSSRDVEVNESYTGGTVGKIMVMACHYRDGLV